MTTKLGADPDVVGFYFQDYDDHGDEFEPFFLLNDILRFWRTLTLNYEHDRYQRLSGDEPRDPEAEAKSALKNYKLKFSRLMICFSMVAWLVSDDSLSRERVIEACRCTPFERLRQVASRRSQEARFEEMSNLYEAFLRVTQVPKEDLLTRFADEGERRRLTQDATKFGDSFYRLLFDVARDPIERYLVI